MVTKNPLCWLARGNSWTWAEQYGMDISLNPELWDFDAEAAQCLLLSKQLSLFLLHTQSNAWKNIVPKLKIQRKMWKEEKAVPVAES